jgi:hypothetical protein
MPSPTPRSKRLSHRRRYQPRCGAVQSGLITGGRPPEGRATCGNSAPRRR